MREAGVLFGDDDRAARLGRLEEKLRFAERFSCQQGEALRGETSRGEAGEGLAGKKTRS